MLLVEIVKIVNHIQFKPVNVRLFKILCEGMGSEHTALLLHTEVRWLLRGKVFIRIFELRSEISAFFVEPPSLLSHRLTSTKCLQKFEYSGDIFTKTNGLSL
jgi:hypothetical protein